MDTSFTIINIIWERTRVPTKNAREYALPNPCYNSEMIDQHLILFCFENVLICFHIRPN